MKSLWSTVLDRAWRLLDIFEPQLVPARVAVPSSAWSAASTLPSALRHDADAARWSADGSSRHWKRRSLDRFAHYRRG